MESPDSRNQSVDVFRGDAIDDQGPGIVWLNIQAEPVLRAGADEILDEIHATTQLDPAIVEVGIVGLDDDVGLQEYVTVESQVPEG